MSAVDVVLPRLKIEEGFRSTSYRDTRGFLTIGYGFNVDAGITEPEAAALLTAQVTERHNALLVFGWYAALDDARQSVCIDISFNCGFENFVNGWPLLIAALKAGDWAAAQQQCHTSTTEDEGRYQALGQILLTGNP